jgi:DNA-binding protein WhiA
MSNPEKGYHLEWRAEDESLARTLLKLLERSGIPAGSYERREQQVIYLKDADRISEMLALMGASGSVLQMENIRIRRQTRGKAVRAANCDEHNSEKMLDAALKQVQACRDIGVGRGLFTLPPALREMARVRMEHPEMSLTEPDEMMEPPLSKSAVNHRMRRLMKIAEELE